MVAVVDPGVVPGAGGAEVAVHNVGSHAAVEGRAAQGVPPEPGPGAGEPEGRDDEEESFTNTERGNISNWRKLLLLGKYNHIITTSNGTTKYNLGISICNNSIIYSNVINSIS